MSGLLLLDEIIAEMIGGALPAWLDDAACKGMDPDIFFPEQGNGWVHAAAICATCPVQQECLDWALQHEETEGVWGGTSQRERRRIKRRAA
jgi:WhiB family redox-sensing transcriptional regulator